MSKTTDVTIQIRTLSQKQLSDQLLHYHQLVHLLDAADQFPHTSNSKTQEQRLYVCEEISAAKYYSLLVEEALERAGLSPAEHPTLI